MELVTSGTLLEYEAFVRGHRNGSFTQSSLWQQVKNNWGWEGILSRDSAGAIKGACGVLIQELPAMKTSFLYAPRGPVCDYDDIETLKDLKSGADMLAKRYHAHTLKWDPDTTIENATLTAAMQEMGFTQIAGSTGFETIQARFNYRLYLEGRSEEALFANLLQKTRYNVRVAQKKGVTVRVAGIELLPEFCRLMKLTGERDGFNIRPPEYFERFLTALSDSARLYVAEFQGQVISGAITVNYGGKTCYVYGASDNALRNTMSTYLLQWEMIRWAVETGCNVYDFQGVSGDISEDNPLYGLYRFKRGFNGSLDELCGEFDFVYRPTVAKLVDAAINAREEALKLKRKLTKA